MPVKINGQLVELSQQIAEIDRLDYEESLYEFMKASWRINDPHKWVDGWCVEAVCEHLQAVVDGQIKNLIINQPPRTGKSAACSVSLAPWTWAQSARSFTSGPGVSFLYASFNDRLSARDSIKSRRIIESSWYQAHWGDRFKLLEDQNTRTRFGNDQGGERLITSIQSSGATGDGMDIGVVDDPNSAREVESEAIIEQTLDWWDGTMSTRLNDMNLGAFIVNQQRLGENDLTGHILSKEADDWCLLMLPMHYDPERSFFLPTGWKDPRTVPGELLWPERFSEQSIATLERKLGAWRAAGQLEQSPQPRGGGVIKRADWKLWQADTYPPMNFILGCVDTAFTLDTMNDPSGMIVWGAFNLDRTQHANQIYNRVTKKLMSIDRLSVDNLAHAMAIFGWTERYEFHQLIERVVQTARKFKVDLLLIENKASGISLGQELRRLYADEKFGVQFFDPKSQDKFARLVSVQHIFQEGHVCAPETEWAEAIITQVGQFPRAKHDEYVDLTSMGIRYLRDNGLLLRAPEVEAERDSHIVYPGGNGAGALYPC
jgi:predicted phage terminase large subunit-like protein